MLSMLESEHPACNLSTVVTARFTIWRWKQMMWLLRVRAAMRLEDRVFRRPARWLARLYRGEVATLWGHLGQAVQTLDGPRGAAMFK